jgi:hypothetical protein
MGRLVLALVFVLAVGLPAARAVVPAWSVALPLSGLTSGLILTVAAIGSLLTGTTLWPWTLGCVAAAWAASALVLRRRARRSGSGAGPLPGATRLRALFIPAALSAPVLAATLAPPTEYDARAIWFFHAHWFWQGGDAARDAMANAAFSYSHADYPPLVPASSAALWSVVGRVDLSLAQAVTTVQSWLAVLLVAVLVGGLVRRRAELSVAVAAGVFTVGCFGVAGGFGTRGYADLLWAAAAVAGAVVALVLPVNPVGSRLAVVCFAAAVLAKGEGLVTVPLLFAPLAALRWAVVSRRRALPSIAGLVGVVVTAGCWLAIAGQLVSHPQRDITPGSVVELLRGAPSKEGRLEPALEGLWGFSRNTLLTAGLVVVMGMVMVGGIRRRRQLGSGLWLPLAAVGAFALFVVVLAAGELDVHFWVAAGGFRTMTVVRNLLLAEVLVIGALALDELLAPGARDDPPEQPPPARATTRASPQPATVGPPAGP